MLQKKRPDRSGWLCKSKKIEKRRNLNIPEYSITENEMCEIIKCISEGYVVEELYASEIMYIKMCNKKTVPEAFMEFDFPRCD